MVYTITFSPALDYVIDLEEFSLGEINRSQDEHMLPGGKGINVSIVLSALGTPSMALGFIGGFVGDYIKKSLHEMGVKTDFVEVNGNTRINVKIRSDLETAINGQGPKVSEENIEELMAKIEKLDSSDLLVISGAIPNSLPSDTYEKILERIKGKNIEVVVDTTKDSLLKTLKYHPLLVKPNKEELEELFDSKITNDQQLYEAATKLVKLGAKNVIVSLGGEGACLVNEKLSPMRMSAPKGKVVNTVGSGDSLVAGFIDEYLRSQDVVAAFHQGVITGSASAFSETLATKKEVEELMKSSKEEQQ